MTHHHCTTCNRQALHPGTTFGVCAVKGEMPERDFTTEPMNGSPPASSWYRDDDGTTSIERYAQAKAAEAERLRELLWLRHGCPISALYGDDGEMQCGKCLIDFKRLPADKIAEAFERTALAGKENQ